MKFSEKWLREWVDPPIGTDALVAQLTAAGLEVDSVVPVGGALEGIVIAEVLNVESHPNADRLSLCQVSTGDGDALPVVCGAPNVHAGMRAPFAQVGATLADGSRVRRGKIRGEKSEGMLCSAQELALGEDADGLMALPEDAPVGIDLRTWLQLDDVAIDIDLTPNRGDCLGISGIAREVGVLNRCPIAAQQETEVVATVDDTFPLALDAPEGCARYVGRVIRDIDARAHTPLWLTERLRRSGVRPISPVVDVTNYVMLELGQPMHAFDLDTLRDGIRVRWGRAGERLRLLDDTEIEVDEHSLLIADETRPVALAGVMGGLDSGVSEQTRHIFLESAWFEPRAIALEARRQGLHTDASHRFERGVACDLQRRAAERATALLLDIVGGQPGPIVESTAAEHLPAAPTIVLRTSRIRRLLGVDVASGEVVDILERLGLEVTVCAGGWRVVPPPYRSDLTIEADLIEEIARVIGFDNIPGELPSAPLGMAARPESQVGLARLREVLIDRGYQEAITYSFVAPALQRLLDPELSAVALSNPISADLAVMRTSLWPGLIAALQYNLNRQQSRVRLFESGMVFRPREQDIDQHQVLAGVIFGSAYPEQWSVPAGAADFFDLKADVEALLALTGRPDETVFAAAAHPALHPGQAAQLTRSAQVVGMLGALHPRIVRELKLPAPVYLFELPLALIETGHLPRFEAISRFPTVRRDLAVIVPETVTADALRNCVGQAGVDVLQNLELFDVYRGEGIDSGKKSVALGLTFQAASRTLLDQEIDTILNKILDSLTKHLGATLRG